MRRGKWALLRSQFYIIPLCNRPSETLCSELKFYSLLHGSDVWELGPKLVFRGSDPPEVFLTCVFSLAL